MLWNFCRFALCRTIIIFFTFSIQIYRVNAIDYTGICSCYFPTHNWLFSIIHRIERNMVYRIRENISMNIRKPSTLQNVISPLINWLLSFAKHQIESVQLLLISEQIQFFSEQIQRQKQDFCILISSSKIQFMRKTFCIFKVTVYKKECLILNKTLPEQKIPGSWTWSGFNNQYRWQNNTEGSNTPFFSPSMIIFTGLDNEAT